MTYQPHQSEDATLKVAGCWCRGCTTEMMQTRFGPLPVQSFVVCPDCGCKRCPRAESHAAECTGTIEPADTPSGVTHTCSGCIENLARWDAAIRGIEAK